MKVSELKYERLSIEKFAAEIQKIIAQVKNASSAQEVMDARNRCNDLYIRLETAQALSYMRYSINTADEFYLAEKDYYDEVGPQAQNYMLEYTKAMLETPFRREMEESGRIIPLVFRSFEVELKSMSPEIVPDLVEEKMPDRPKTLLDEKNIRLQMWKKRRQLVLTLTVPMEKYQDITNDLCRVISLVPACIRKNEKEIEKYV